MESSMLLNFKKHFEFSSKKELEKFLHYIASFEQVERDFDVMESYKMEDKSELRFIDL